jgi:hypothetical protein
LFTPGIDSCSSIPTKEDGVVFVCGMHRGRGLDRAAAAAAAAAATVDFGEPVGTVNAAPGFAMEALFKSCALSDRTPAAFAAAADATAAAAAAFADAATDAAAAAWCRCVEAAGMIIPGCIGIRGIGPASDDAGSPPPIPRWPGWTSKCATPTGGGGCCIPSELLYAMLLYTTWLLYACCCMYACCACIYAMYPGGGCGGSVGCGVGCGGRGTAPENCIGVYGRAIQNVPFFSFCVRCTVCITFIPYNFHSDPTPPRGPAPRSPFRARPRLQYFITLTFIIIQTALAGLE